MLHMACPPWALNLTFLVLMRSSLGLGQLPFTVPGCSTTGSLPVWQRLWVFPSRKEHQADGGTHCFQPLWSCNEKFVSISLRNLTTKGIFFWKKPLLLTFQIVSEGISLSQLYFWGNPKTWSPEEPAGTLHEGSPCIGCTQHLSDTKAGISGKKP